LPVVFFMQSWRTEVWPLTPCKQWQQFKNNDTNHMKAEFPVLSITESAFNNAYPSGYLTQSLTLKNITLCPHSPFVCSEQISE
jgi:hypothetical protein